MALFKGHDIVTPIKLINRGGSEELSKMIDGSISTITIPNNITNIKDYAFYGCSNLTTISIPNNITSIGVNAFGNCSNLTSIVVDQYSGVISGAPWGATNATITYNKRDNASINLTGYGFTIDSNYVTINNYLDENENVVIPVVEE